MQLKIIPVLISFRTPLWIRVGLRSFQRHFPHHPVLVIDNNPLEHEQGWEPACEREREWLSKCDGITFVRHPGPNRRHGAAFDFALDRCREIGADVLLHFEPDCLITGKSWFELLRRPICAGAWMSGMVRHMYGPLHPCPSMWRVDQDWSSFLDQSRGADVLHPRFNELFFLQRLLNAIEMEYPHALAWWRENWDTAQKNWFLAAAQDQAVQVPQTGDFRHFWAGSTVHRNSQELTNNPLLRELVA